MPFQPVDKALIPVGDRSASTAETPITPMRRASLLAASRYSRRRFPRLSPRSSATACPPSLPITNAGIQVLVLVPPPSLELRLAAETLALPAKAPRVASAQASTMATMTATAEFATPTPQALAQRPRSKRNSTTHPPPPLVTKNSPTPGILIHPNMGAGQRMTRTWMTNGTRTHRAWAETTSSNARACCRRAGSSKTHTKMGTGTRGHPPEVQSASWTFSGAWASRGLAGGSVSHEQS
jgi:hypothetical protein